MDINRVLAIFVLLFCVLCAGCGQNNTQGSVEESRDENLPIDVHSYGAIGDGMTDDSAAFQSALNAGGNILVPAGSTFLIGSTLSISSNTLLLIEGTLQAQNTLDAPIMTASHKTNVKISGAGIIKVNASNRASTQGNLAAIKFDTCSQCGVYGLTIDGGRPGLEGATGNNGIIHLLDSIDCVVEGLTILNSPIDGIFIVGGSKHTIRNNNGYNIKGSFFGSNTDPTHLSVTENSADSSGYTCISVNGDYSVVKGNIVRNCTYSGITLGHDSTTSHAHYSILTDNVSESNRLDGISVSFSHYSIIAHNTVEGNARKGIYIQFGNTHKNGTTERLVIKGNNVYNNTGGGIYVLDDSGPGHIIEENNCSGNGASGIYIEHSYTGDDFHIIKNNKCIRNAGAGLELSSATNCIIEGNILNMNGTYGLLVAGGGNHIFVSNFMEGNTLQE